MVVAFVVLSALVIVIVIDVSEIALYVVLKWLALCSSSSCSLTKIIFEYDGFEFIRSG